MLLERKNAQYRFIQMREDSQPKTPKSDMTYIIGSIDGSRPVSAASIRLLRPRSSMERAITPVKNVGAIPHQGQAQSQHTRRHSSATTLSRPMSRASVSTSVTAGINSHARADELDTVNMKLYDSHHPPRELAKYFQGFETIEHLNADMDGSAAMAPTPDVSYEQSPGPLDGQSAGTACTCTSVIGTRPGLPPLAAVLSLRSRSLFDGRRDRK
ncbi:hypothetical protein BC831DRAFT_402512 [Entophlyctis helioformis]|nr:hypothetical protein BC831DRAFT_402512 [Entophlyctis helioformis]